MKQIKLHTSVPVEPAGFTLSHTDSVLLIGSCFTENMGQRMAVQGFDTMLNPFGILYNPLSIAEALDRCLDGRHLGDSELVHYEGLWHSWLHHGSFSHSDRQHCIDLCDSAVDAAHDFLLRPAKLIVTFGSAWYYRLKSTGLVVANCHKVPATDFTLHLATVEEVVAAWKPLILRLQKLGIETLFTISPVRHNAYGAHGNQLGKAVLLLAIEELCKQHGTKYFPAYEIVVDELRDYRFYADDLSHPSALAEEIVWQRFQQATMTSETIALCEQRDKESRQAAHRPIHK